VLHSSVSIPDFVLYPQSQVWIQLCHNSINFIRLLAPPTAEWNLSLNYQTTPLHVQSSRTKTQKRCTARKASRGSSNTRSNEQLNYCLKFTAPKRYFLCSSTPVPIHSSPRFRFIAQLGLKLVKPSRRIREWAGSKSRVLCTRIIRSVHKCRAPGRPGRPNFVWWCLTLTV
jgi:hypothetical protein